MRAAFAIVLVCLLAMTLVVRATPRACGSAFACCDTTKIAKPVAPCCEKETTPRGPAHHLDEPMACCVPLTMPAAIDTPDLATHALVGDGARFVERSIDPRTLEPATPPPRTIA